MVVLRLPAITTAFRGVAERTFIAILAGARSSLLHTRPQRRYRWHAMQVARKCWGDILTSEPDLRTRPSTAETMCAL